MPVKFFHTAAKPSHHRTGHPTYKNIHNVINSSPMFKEASIVTSHLYKRRKERNDLLKNASVGAAHDNNL